MSKGGRTLDLCLKCGGGEEGRRLRELEVGDCRGGLGGGRGGDRRGGGSEDSEGDAGLPIPFRLNFPRCWFLLELLLDAVDCDHLFTLPMPSFSPENVSVAANATLDRRLEVVVLVLDLIASLLEWLGSEGGMFPEAREFRDVERFTVVVEEDTEPDRDLRRVLG